MSLRIAAIVVVAFLAGIGSLSTPGFYPPPSQGSVEISDHDFARLVRTLSEPEGYFNSDNFISNEAGYLKIMPLLDQLSIRGGVYLGVGPDQNYSYIAEIHPQLALMVDIRRQNLIEHLYYKALFSLSPNRIEFLQRLFGRRIHPDQSKSTGEDIGRIISLLEATPRDANLESDNIRDVERLMHTWQVDLSEGDYRSVEYVARALMDSGPEIQFTSYNRPPQSWYPTYGELILATDSDGRRANYLATEERYRTIRALHRGNRIIPVIADLSGQDAMANIARELRARRLEVSCFYVSNVEFYLYGRYRWTTYVRNMRALPWEPNALIIRSFSNTWHPHPASINGYHMTTVLQRVSTFLANEETGRNSSYWDLVTNDYIAPELK